MKSLTTALLALLLAGPAIADKFPKRYYIAAGTPVLPTCNDSPSRDGRIYAVLDPQDAADCKTGNGTDVTHLCVCHGAAETWVPLQAAPSDITVFGQLTLLDEQGAGGTDVTFAIASTPEQMFWFDTAVIAGGVTDRINADCVGSTDPYPCCSGAGTGTCADLTVPAGTYDVGIEVAAEGASNSQLECWLYDDGVEASGKYAPRKFGTGGDVGYTGVHADSITVGADSVMTLWCQSDGTDALNVWRGSMRLVRIGS